MTAPSFGATSIVLPLDTARILGALDEADVRYILIGGLAAIAHGSTMATSDADLLPSLETENLDRLLTALASLEAKVLVAPGRLAMEDGEIWESMELDKGGAGLRSAEAWHFSTDAGPVDVVMSAAGVGTYEAHTSEERLVFGAVVAVASKADILQSKRALGRPKDRFVVEELEGSVDT